MPSVHSDPHMEGTWYIGHMHAMITLRDGHKITSEPTQSFKQQGKDRVPPLPL